MSRLPTRVRLAAVSRRSERSAEEEEERHAIVIHGAAAAGADGPMMKPESP